MIPRRVFSGRLFLLGAVFLGGAWALAQQAPPPELPATVLRDTTRLVLVDVVVTDKDGKPVRDLTRHDFQIFEDSKPQPPPPPPGGPRGRGGGGPWGPPKRTKSRCAT